MSAGADDDIPAEVDFSKGQRGKFFRPGARIVMLSKSEQGQLRKTIAEADEGKTISAEELFRRLNKGNS